jgi:hypothetical protein
MHLETNVTRIEVLTACSLDAKYSLKTAKRNTK